MRSGRTRECRGRQPFAGARGVLAKTSFSLLRAAAGGEFGERISPTIWGTTHFFDYGGEWQNRQWQRSGKSGATTKTTRASDGATFICITRCSCYGKDNASL